MKQTAPILAIVAAAFVAGTVHAQATGPAEPPPADFAANEYVDSTGCVFARVGLGEEVVWVPRVGPDRTPLCGRTPSVTPEADVAEAPAAAPVPTLEPLPVASSVPPATPTRTAIRRQVNPAAPSGMTHVHAPVSTSDLVLARTMTAEEAELLGHPGVLLPPTVSADDVYLRNTCPGRMGLAYAYVTEPPEGCRIVQMNRADIVHGTEPPAAPASHSPVARLRIDAPTAPAGYRVAWDDGRLNPYRGIRTPEGDAQTRMVWTDTVPRRLVPAD